MDITHGHSFNDKIYFPKIFKLRAGRQSFPDLCRFILRYALLGYVLC